MEEKISFLSSFYSNKLNNFEKGLINLIVTYINYYSKIHYTDCYKSKAKCLS